MHTDTMKVALVHDWMNGMRGGERVLEQFCELFPEAEIFTLFYVPGSLNHKIERHRIHTSFLNKFPNINRYYRFLLPLMPLAIERFNFAGYDLILSTSHCVAKGVVPPPDAVHISYCFTPMRYAWDRFPDYFGGKKLEGLYATMIHGLRKWDVTSSARVDHFVGISNWVAKRINKYYRREAAVIYPPVNTRYYSPTAGDKGDYYLVVSAFAPYKRIDLAIDACIKMNRRLIVVGGGQEFKKLKRHKFPSHIEFLGQQSDEVIRDLYAGARAFLFPGEEDFGITPLEAMACGTPVIAYRRGGATETVQDQRSGLFFSEQSVEALCHAIIEFESKSWEAKICREQAEKFNVHRFQREILAFVRKATEHSSQVEHLSHSTSSRILRFE